MTEPLFDPGPIVMSFGALTLMGFDDAEYYAKYLHAHGNYGVVSEARKYSNEALLELSKKRKPKGYIQSAFIYKHWKVIFRTNLGRGYTLVRLHGENV